MRKTMIPSSAISIGASTQNTVTTAVTTTGTSSFTTVNSVSITPMGSGKVYIDINMFVSNNTAGDGVKVQFAINGTAVITQSFISSAANQAQQFSFSYIYAGTPGTAVNITTGIEAVTGGTASAIGNVVAYELIN